MFRALATLLAVYLISLGWVKLAGAAYLLYLSVHHFMREGGEESRRTPPKARPLLGLSAFWATVVKVELTDIVFAIDSIPAIFAVTREPFLVYTSNVFAILGLRSLYIVLGGAVSRLRYLRFGLAFILAFVAVKLLLSGGSLLGRHRGARDARNRLPAVGDVDVPPEVIRLTKVG